MSYRRSITETDRPVLSLEQARALAVTAAGLASPRPPRARTSAQMRSRAVGVVRRMGYVQIDSVNVLARAQDMVLFSRIGAVSPDILTLPGTTSRPPTSPDVVEQFAHEACVLVPEVAALVARWPRMGLWGTRLDYMSHPAWEDVCQRVIQRLATSPGTALQIADEFVGEGADAGSGPSDPTGLHDRAGLDDPTGLHDRPGLHDPHDPHDRSDPAGRPDPALAVPRRFVESCAIHAFATGQLVGVGRTTAFQRLLTPPRPEWPGWSASSAVVRPAGPGSSTPDRVGAVRESRHEAAVELTRIALRGLGIARPAMVADWFRLPVAETADALDRLRREGSVVAVEVRGTRSRVGDPWWVPTELIDEGGPWSARSDAALGAGSASHRDRIRLLSPFDHLVANRARLWDLFDVHYRIGIYTPREKRQFGYYDLLALIGNDIVGRVDLRAQRSTRRLLVMGGWWEPGHGRAAMRQARGIRQELFRIARWQGLDEVVVDPDARGDAVPALTRVLVDR